MTVFLSGLALFILGGILLMLLASWRALTYTKFTVTAVLSVTLISVGTILISFGMAKMFIS